MGGTAWRLLLASVFALATAHLASAIEMTPELKKVVEGAKAEGKLRIETLPDVLAGWPEDRPLVAA